jgi:hypothetical protein
MRWTYSIKNKITASVVLLALCLLVLLSHYLDRMHTQNVKNAVSTLYEDRLIAEDYILKMTNTTYQIREVLNSDLDRTSKSDAIRKLTEKFHSIYTIYLKTKLTKPEKATAVELIWYLKKFGQTTLKNNHQPSNYTDKILFSLDKLSTIQLEESKLIMKKVESQYATIKASSQFAFVIVIIILVVLQILVFSGESIIPIVKSKDPTLN